MVRKHRSKLLAIIVVEKDRARAMRGRGRTYQSENGLPGLAPQSELRYRPSAGRINPGFFAPADVSGQIGGHV